MLSSKKHNVREPEYIDSLPENIIPITKYQAYSEIVFEFNRYWWDPINSSLIMKPKRMKRFKIVKPINDKNHVCDYVYLFDVNNNRIWVNYDRLINQYMSE